MLLYLHVKNLALIEEEEIAFKKGLNILTGETGAGKSILLGALNLALGGKVPKGFVRDTESDGIVEAAFSVDHPLIRRKLSQMDIDTYDDEVILSRRISETRSVAKINGEVVPAHKMSEVGELLLDIYGQHEHQSLTEKKRHLEMLDEFGKESIADLKREVSDAYKEYRRLLTDLNQNAMDEGERLREISFLEHEINEIASANLIPEEDNDLEAEYNRLKNGQKIISALSDAYHNTGEMNAASDLIGRAVQQVRSVSEYDTEISDMASLITDVDSILNDFNRQISDYMNRADFDEGHFADIERRLNLINELKMKYGRTIEDILHTLDEKQDRLTSLQEYDEYLMNLKSSISEAKDRLQVLSDQLTKKRQELADDLVERVSRSLSDLNFLDVQFDMEFSTLSDFTENGIDDAEFVISTNPGEPLRPLKDIASGGEMSRIMLAMKTVIAEQDSIDTLIFDEIDAGISGRTAQAVSEKLSDLALDHQIICITHLPQIASMADNHFLIEKSASSGSTISTISPLTSEESIRELARMLGGVEITDAVLSNAREMKELANSRKRSFGR